MKLGTAAAILALVSPGSALGHRLDEYLQATMIKVGKERVEAQVHLTPGVAVFGHVLAAIDIDGDGVISPAEQRAYAERVRGDLSLTFDGRPVRLQLIAAKFPEIDEIKEGLGDIQLDFAAEVPGGAAERSLVFENHHQSPIAAYLVNCLAPGEAGLRVVSQSRSYDQSHYQVNYVQDRLRAGWSGGRGWAGLVGLLLLARLATLWWREQES